MKKINTSSEISTQARFTTFLSLVIGAAYYLYLVNTSYPLAVIRIIPFVWLVSSITGFIMGIQAMRVGEIRLSDIIISALSLLSIILAAIFSLASLMGD